MRTLTAIVFLLSVTFAHAQSYVFFSFDPPGSKSTTPAGINAAGDIVGYFDDASGTHGFLRTGASYSTIDVPNQPGARTYPAAINRSGEIVGWFSGATGTHGFLRSADGQYTIFDAPDLGVGVTNPTGINDRGDIVGNGYSGALVNYGFLRASDGSFITIDFRGASSTYVEAINNAGEIAGTIRIGGSNGFLQGFVRSPQGAYQLVNAPGVAGARVVGINNAGQVMGYFGNTVFVQSSNGATSSFPGFEPATVPADLNDAGVVVGSYTAASAGHGFLATPGGGDSRPVIRSERGVISAFAFGGADTIAPGAWIEIYGQNLSRETFEWTANSFRGNSAPTMLGAVSVRINGQPAAVSYISPGQINAQVPSTVEPGTARVTVTSQGFASVAYSVEVRPVQPGVLAFPQVRPGAREVVALFPDNLTYALPPDSTWTVPRRVAHPGDTLTMYGIGFGPVTPDLPSGQIATEPASLPSPLQILFNGVPGTVVYAGIAPGSVGLYQFNVIVPQVAGLPGNLADVEFRYAGVTALPPLTIALAP